MPRWKAVWAVRATRSPTSSSDRQAKGGRVIPTYAYKAYNDRGAVETGQLDSPSEQAAFETLRALGLTVVDLQLGAAIPALPWWKRDITLGSGELSLGDQAALAEQMATMFRVRLPVLDMLRMSPDVAAYLRNRDPKSPQFVALRDELARLAAERGESSVVLAGQAIRVSLGPLTTEDEVLRFAETWLAQYRKALSRAA